MVHRSRHVLRAALLICLVVVLTHGPVHALGAVSGSGAAPEPGASGGSRPIGDYAPPVDRRVADPFHLDHGPYGPGNRGLEYATLRGDVVRAIGAGKVAFAGPVAGRLVVSVEHPDGLRSMLTGLVRIEVATGDLVARGTPVGVAGPGLHLGVRRGGRYLDPSTLLRRSGRAVLVSPEGP